MELNTLLLDVQSLDPKKRNAAEAQISNLERNYTSDYILQLAYELANVKGSREVRQLAGISMKNLLLNSRQDPHLENAWNNCHSKQTVREQIIATLGCSDRDVRKAAAQAVASVAKHDLPTHSWEGLLNILIQNASNTNICYKTASLMTLGYICEGIGSGVLNKEQGDMILTGICASLTQEETDFNVRSVAMQALVNSLKFYKANFENEEERRYIISLLIQNLNERDLNIQISCLRALCEISSLYYSYLAGHLSELIHVSYPFIENETGQICILAIELWSTLAEEEIARINTISSMNFISKAARSLSHILVSKLSSISHEEDWTEWNEQKAAASCLNLISQLCPDIFEIIELFIRNEIHSESWEKRQAALLALGSVLEYISPERAYNTLNIHIDYIRDILLSDTQLLKETAAWCLAKISETNSDLIIEHNLKKVLVEELFKHLAERNKVAIHLCWGLSNLMDIEPLMFDLRDLDWIITGTINSIDKNEFNEFTLGVFSLLTCTLEKIPTNSSYIIEGILGNLISMLRNTISNSKLSSVYVDQMAVMVSSAIQIACSKITPGFLSIQQAGIIVQSILHLFNEKKCIVEEAVQALGAIAMNLESNFIAFLKDVLPFVNYSIRQLDTVSVMKSGVLCLGDFARAVGEHIAVYLDEVIPSLKKILQDDKIPLDLKLQCLSTLSDLAVSSGSRFITYLNDIYQIVDSAAWVSIQHSDDEETSSYLSLLREHILDFYVGVIQCLKQSKSLHLILTRIQSILEYISICLTLSKSRDFDTITIGLIGDILLNFPELASSVESTSSSYLSYVYSNSEGQTKEIACWAESYLHSLLINT